MDDVWVEKYRPSSLDDVVGQDSAVNRLKCYAEQKNMPHMLFAGSAGTGKTTCAILLAKGIFGESWKANFYELNASDERGIDVVRTKIKEFARTSSMGNAPFKIIFLDEADALTPDAQAALRRTMEKYSSNCRFILSCNYSSKILDPIQSRCAMFRFRSLSEEAMTKRLREIAEDENLSIDDDALRSVWHISGGDMRKAINVLQMAASITSSINEDTVYSVTGLAKREAVENMLKLALEGRFFEAREVLDKLLIEDGVSGEDIIKQIHRELNYLPIEDRLRVVLIDKTGEIEFRLVEGSNERIQLSALLAYFTLAKHGISQI